MLSKRYVFYSSHCWRKSCLHAVYIHRYLFENRRTFYTSSTTPTPTLNKRRVLKRTVVYRTINNILGKYTQRSKYIPHCLLNGKQAFYSSAATHRYVSCVYVCNAYVCVCAILSAIERAGFMYIYTYKRYFYYMYFNRIMCVCVVG